MKKVLSVFLAALMLFTCFGVMAYAADGDENKVPIEVTFSYLVYTYDSYGDPNGVDDCTETWQAEKNADITSGQLNSWLKEMPKELSYQYDVEEYGSSIKETVTYTFKYFTMEGDETGYKYTFEGIDKEVLSADRVFVAHYDKEDTIDNVTFWEFVQSIFARINRIFEYFAAIFGIE